VTHYLVVLLIEEWQGYLGYSTQTPTFYQYDLAVGNTAHVTGCNLFSYRQNPLASCEEFLNLVAWEASGSNLPGEHRRELHRAFAITATYAEGKYRYYYIVSNWPQYH
jgi:hypothetical protein